MTVFECFEEIQLDLFRAQNYDFTDPQIKRLDFIKQHLCDDEIEKDLERLAELEAMIKSGRLAELPCEKPCEKGDRYYIIDVKMQKIFEGEINDVNYDKTYGYICQFSWKDCDYMVPSNLELLGTSFNEMLHRFYMYKTQAEAEAKLEELKNK